MAFETMGILSQVGGVVPLVYGGYQLSRAALNKFYYRKPLLAEGPFSKTENMMDLAKLGKIPRAYQRERQMQQLIGDITQGSVVIQGPPGSGKTALVEELVCRIYHGEIPSLKGMEIIRLKMRQAKGGAGFQNLIQNFWTGGAENRVRELIEYLEYQFGKDKSYALFIDEIQDLLTDNISMFDSFKEELARKGVRLIGATTSESVVYNLRNRDNTGAGMGRRIQELKLQEMTKEEAEIVITYLMKQPPAKYSNITFTYEKNFEKAVIELAKDRYPDKIFPDCAVCLFEELHRYYFDHQPKQAVNLGLKEVSEYITQTKGGDSTQLSQKVTIKAQKELFRQNFQQQFFPRLKITPSPFKGIVSESERFKIYFQENPDHPFLFFVGDSEIFLAEIAAHSHAKGGVYHCDATQLFRQSHDSDLPKLLTETLSKLFKDSKKKPLLVLTGFLSSWCDFHPTPPEKKDYGTIESQFVKELKPFVTAFEQGSKTTSSTEEVKPKPPPLIQQLMQFIEDEKVPTVVLFSSTFHQLPKRDKWQTFEIPPLSTDEVLLWLEKKQIDKSWSVREILWSCYSLQNPSIPFSVVDLAARTLECSKTDKDVDLAMLRAAKGFISLNQIQTALKKSKAQMNELPFTLITGGKEAQHLAFPCLSSRSILWVAESSPFRRRWISFQIAALMKKEPLDCFSYEPSHDWKELPANLKEHLLQSLLQKKDVIFITEADLSDTIFQKVLRKTSCRIICFYTPAPSQTPDSKFPSSILKPLIAEGKALINELLPSSLPAVPALGFKSSYYTPPPLTPEELKQIFSLYSLNTSEAIRFHILSLYELLCKSGKSIDTTLDNFEKDAPLLISIPSQQIYPQFTQLYGAELKMSLLEIQYAIHPRITPWGYRLYRPLKDTLTYGLHLLGTPFRWLASYLMAGAAPLVGGWLLSRIALALRR